MRAATPIFAHRRRRIRPFGVVSPPTTGLYLVHLKRPEEVKSHVACSIAVEDRDWTVSGRGRIVCTGWGIGGGAGRPHPARHDRTEAAVALEAGAPGGA